MRRLLLTTTQGETTMSDTRLTREHELSLLKKLSTDDDYRARFEKDPSGALKEIGVPDKEIAALDPANLKPGTLADKATLAAAHAKLSDTSVSDHVCLIVPFMRTNYGKAD